MQAVSVAPTVSIGVNVARKDSRLKGRNRPLMCFFCDEIGVVEINLAPFFFMILVEERDASNGNGGPSSLMVLFDVLFRSYSFGLSS